MTRSSLLIVLLPIFYLAAILSGTRGIWLAILGPMLSLIILLPKSRSKRNRHILLYISSFFLLFFLLFLVANPILTSNQFQIDKDGGDLLRERLKSILDLNELSNSGRILIWKASLTSINKQPLIGVGIGNFPTVLSQGIDAAKEGSSAHNLYLHIAAEVGVVALFVSLVFGWVILVRGFEVFKKSPDNFIKIFAGSAVLYLIWIFFYSLTDAALFDERAFLLFISVSSILLGLYESKINPHTHV